MSAGGRIMRNKTLWIGALALLATSAFGAGLQVTPVSLRLVAARNADGLTLSNAGTERLQAQVRVYQWTQSDGKDQLTPSDGLVISPPMLTIEPGAEQLVRVIRTGPPPAGAAEQAYRLAIDELPGETNDKGGLQFVLHYSVPVFLEPKGAPPQAPQLSWQLLSEGGKAVLQVANAGTLHAQLAQVRYVAPSGNRVVIHDGLLGYVLPGATMRWPLNQPSSAFAGSGTFEAMINGEQATQAATPVVPGAR